MATRNVKRPTRRTVRALNVTRKTVRPGRTPVRGSVSADIDTAILDGVVRLSNRAVGKTPWSGSMTELEVALRKIIRRSVSNWPQNPRAMRASLDRVVTKLRRLGVKTRFGRTSDHSRKRFVEFTR